MKDDIILILNEAKTSKKIRILKSKFYKAEINGKSFNISESKDGLSICCQGFHCLIKDKSEIQEILNKINEKVVEVQSEVYKPKTIEEIKSEVFDNAPSKQNIIDNNSSLGNSLVIEENQ